MSRKFFSVFPISTSPTSNVTLINLTSLQLFTTKLDKDLQDNILNIDFSSPVNDCFNFKPDGETFHFKDLLNSNDELVTDIFTFSSKEPNVVTIKYNSANVKYDIKFTLLQPDIKIPKSVGQLLHDNDCLLGLTANGKDLGVFAGYDNSLISSITDLDDLRERLDLKLRCACISKDNLELVFIAKVADLYINFRLVIDVSSSELIDFYCIDKTKFHFFADDYFFAE